MFTYLLFILFFLIFVHILFNYNRTARMLRKVPGPKMAFIIGNALDILLPRAQLFKFLRDFGKAWGTLWRLWSFPFGAVCIFDPDDIEVILSGAKHNKKSIFYNFLKPWLQDGLLVSDGDKWQSRRKILTPAFHFNILRRFCAIFEDNSQRFTKNMEKSLGKPVNVVEVISEFTLHTICETAMGTQLDKDTSGESYKEAICRLGDLIVHRVTRTYLYLDFMYYLSATGRSEKKHLNIIHNFTRKVINFRRSFLDTHVNKIEDIEDNDDNICNKNKKTAMLDLLILAEKNGLIDQKGIQEEVDTFMFEGHDTTACGLTYFFVEIANNKDIQDKIVAELRSIFGESKRRATIDDFSKMRYLDRCIKESLRLYPPVPLIARILSEDVKLGIPHTVTKNQFKRHRHNNNKEESETDEIQKQLCLYIRAKMISVRGGYVIPSGTYGIIHIFDLHRCEELYKDPLKFDPDRFLPENSANRHPYAYIPFSAGPRNCIGQKFAMLEMKSVISETLRKFVLLPNTKIEDLDFTVDLVLRTSKPVYASFTKRPDSF